MWHSVIVTRGHVKIQAEMPLFVFYAVQEEKCQVALILIKTEDGFNCEIRMLLKSLIAS